MPIGGCSFFAVETPARTALLGIWLGKPYWDEGLGTDAVRTLCRFGFDHMNLQRIELDVFETNPRASAPTRRWASSSRARAGGRSSWADATSTPT